MKASSVDIVVAIGSVIICVLISLVAKRSNKKTVEDFLLANRKMSAIPVALSTFATMISANGITSMVGEACANGMNVYFLNAASIIVQIPVAFYVIPVFHNMSYTSVYEYIEWRFDRSLRKFYSFIFCLVYLVRCGAYIYVPAITITTVSGISYWIVVMVTGLVCSMYCVIGGFRAVVYTDVFQSALMFTSVILVTVFAYTDFGFSNAWVQTFSGEMDQHFRISEDLNNKYSVWGNVAYGLMFGFFMSVCSQATAQRFLCVKDYKTARNSFLLSQVFVLILMGLLILVSVAVFAEISQCNPFKLPNSGVRLPDQILVYVAAKQLKDYPGLLGLLLAGVVSAALSTASSVINSLAANALEDFILPLKPSLQNDQKKTVLLCKILTGIFGVVTVIIATVVPLIGGVLSVLLLVMGAFVGPTAGILFCGFFYRKCNLMACKISIFLALVFSTWMAVGSYLYHPHKPQFVHSKPQLCDDLILNSSTTFDYYTDSNGTYEKLHETTAGSIYGISSLWFPVVSFSLACLFVVVFSSILGPIKEVDIRLLSPFVLTQVEKEVILSAKRAETDFSLLTFQTAENKEINCNI